MSLRGVAGFQSDLVPGSVSSSRTRPAAASARRRAASVRASNWAPCSVDSTEAHRELGDATFKSKERRVIDLTRLQHQTPDARMQERTVTHHRPPTLSSAMQAVSQMKRNKNLTPKPADLADIATRGSTWYDFCNEYRSLHEQRLAAERKHISDARPNQKRQLPDRLKWGTRNTPRRVERQAQDHWRDIAAIYLATLPDGLSQVTREAYAMIHLRMELQAAHCPGCQRRQKVRR